MEGIQQSIASTVESAIPKLSQNLRRWLQAHRVEPRQFTVFRETDGSGPMSVWLVTDHNGTDDSSYRIIYDPVSCEYGCECLLENDVPYLIGMYGDLKSAVEDL